MYLSAEFYTLSLSHNVVSSTPCLSGIRPYKFSGDRTYCIGAYDARNPGSVYNIMYVNVIIIYSDVRNPGPVNNIIYVNVIIIYSDVRNPGTVNDIIYVKVIITYMDVINPGPVNDIIYVNVIIIYSEVRNPDCVIFTTCRLPQRS